MRLLVGLPVVRRHQEAEGLAEDLALCVAEGPLGSGVEQLDPAPLVGHDDRLEDPFRELAVQPLRGPQRHLGPLAVGDLPRQQDIGPGQLGGALLDPAFKLVVRPPQGLLRPLALGDVMGDTDPSHCAAVGIELDLRPLPDPPRLTIDEDAVLEVVGGSLQRSRPRLEYEVPIVRMDDRPELLVGQRQSLGARGTPDRARRTRALHPAGYRGTSSRCGPPPAHG